MTVLLRHRLPNMTESIYREHSPEILAEVEKAPGFVLHVGFPHPDGGWAVSEIWDSAAQAEANFEANVKPKLPEDVLADQTVEVIDNVNLITARQLQSQ